MQLHRRKIVPCGGTLMTLHGTRTLLAAVALFAIVGAGSAAEAQDETVYIGGNGSAIASGARNSVQVDMSVLDDIGGRPPISQSLLPPPGGSQIGQRVTLSPPGSATARKPQAPRRTAPAAKTPAPRTTSAPVSKPTASASAADGGRAAEPGADRAARATAPDRPRDGHAAAAARPQAGAERGAGARAGAERHAGSRAHARRRAA